ncbi:hypothetical protein X943_003428 [Babesia divergens]|uniref:Uncharacterized protein n=1 Tax=Babesia divergens TaxID=32595 RepID=A0AAD9G7R8_BABDI|nr:hypothetical protein X943_003428 [Babesia divergens]
MAYARYNRISKHWWGVTHFRIGGRTQPRPNKGFRVTHLPTVGAALEHCRWWKYLRRGTLANVLNQQPSSNVQGAAPGLCIDGLFKMIAVTSTYLSEAEKGNATLNDAQLTVLGSYLGVSFFGNRKQRYRRI